MIAGGRLLRPGGLLVIEHDDGEHGRKLAAAAELIGWLDVVDYIDLTGRTRYLTARRPDHEPGAGIFFPADD